MRERARAGAAADVGGAVVVGGEGMLGRAILTELARRGIPCRGCPPPASPARRAALRRSLARRRPETVYWAPPERAGVGRHGRRPATLAGHALSAFGAAIDACRAAGVPRLVNIVPHCAYPGAAPVPLRETTLWDGPPDPGLLAYGAAMRLTIALAAAYRAEHGLFTLSPIVAGLYGPGDLFDAADGQVVGAMIRRFGDAVRRGDDRVPCWGDGAAERELLYVDDAAALIVSLAALPEESFTPWPDTVVNIGGAHAGARFVSTAVLAAAVAAAQGFEGRIEWDRDAPRGRPRVALDDGRLAGLVPAHAALPLAEGLARAVADERAAVVAGRGGGAAA